MQEFATEALTHYGLEKADSDPAKVNRRLGAVIAMLLPHCGGALGQVLKALGTLSEATMFLVQRQEHGAQKEGEPLDFEDARRVVFNVAVVMHELARAFDAVTVPVEPPAFLEPG